MFATHETTEVKLLCDSAVMKAIIDMFGTKVWTKSNDNDHLRAAVKVCTNPMFCRWVFGWGGLMKIEGPDEVKEEFKSILLKEFQKYRDKE